MSIDGQIRLSFSASHRYRDEYVKIDGDRCKNHLLMLSDRSDHFVINDMDSAFVAAKKLFKPQSSDAKSENLRSELSFAHYNSTMRLTTPASVARERLLDLQHLSKEETTAFLRAFPAPPLRSN